jgi:hypothetical protein
VADGEDAGPTHPGDLPEPFSEPEPEQVNFPYGEELY